MEIMSRKEVKRILKQLEKQFGFSDLDYIFVRSDKGKIFIVNKEFSKVDVDNINTIGLYVMKEENDGIRLSIEGSQVIGPNAKKSVLVLDDNSDWLMGKNVSVKTEMKGYAIVKCCDDFLGCGKIVSNKLINYVPKSRRISEVIS